MTSQQPISARRVSMSAEQSADGKGVTGEGRVAGGEEVKREGVRDAATLKLSADAGASLVNCCGGT